MKTAVDLLGRGYFPRELPPSFGTKNFAQFVDTNPQDLRRPRTGPTRCVTHSIPRAQGLRRPLELPNPRSYLILARVLESQWNGLKTHFALESISHSRPRPGGKNDERAVIPRTRLRDLSTIRARRWPAQRHLVRTDIAQFYNSIYTHSVPWAMHGKQYAKIHRDKCDGGRIDKALRQIQHGQTSGIPIGPDASLIVAEIVLTTADHELAKRMGKPLRGHRYIDDYELAFSSWDEAEEALANLESILFELELTLNPYKTGIYPLPAPVDAAWHRELATFPIRTAGSAPEALTDSIAFFDRAIELAQENPESLVYKYALQRARAIPIRTPGWRTFEGMVFTVASSDPTAFPVALDLLRVKAGEAGAKISRTLATDVLEELLGHNVAARRMSEVAWCLWAAIELKLRLSSSLAADVGALDDDLVALVALHAQDAKRFPKGTVDTTLWESLASQADALEGEHWLLTYEGAVRNWIATGAAAVKTDPFFNALSGAGVRFYDTAPPWRPFAGPTAPLPGGTLPEASL